MSAKADEPCPTCGQNWFNTRIYTLGYCILCAIDAGRVDVPPALQAKGWRLARACGHCITAVCRHNHLSLPLFSSFQLDACIAMAERYQWAWEWLHPGGRGYAWGWRLFSEFHITYFVEHPQLGRVPRGRHDPVWLSDVPELIIETLVVEQLQLGWHRRQVAAVTAVYADRAQLLERSRASVAAFDAVPVEQFEQKGFL